MTSTDAFIAPALRSILADTEALAKSLTNPESRAVAASQVRALRLVLTRASRLAAEAREAEAGAGFEPLTLPFPEA